MIVNWDAITGIVLFLAGTGAALGPRWAGVVAMVLGLIYMLRAFMASSETKP